MKTETQKEQNLVYTLEGKIYVNLTNMCSNRCVFCIRNLKNDVEGKNLFLASEDFSADDVIEQFKNVKKNLPNAKETVFCGYGEPLIKFDLFETVASKIKELYPEMKIRVNTNGQANLIHKTDVTERLAMVADAVSISLNADNAENYNKISVPSDKENAYEAVKEFIKLCVQRGIPTAASIVSEYPGFGVNVAACENIAKSLGADFKNRKWLPAGY